MKIFGTRTSLLISREIFTACHRLFTARDQSTTPERLVRALATLFINPPATLRLPSSSLNLFNFYLDSSFHNSTGSHRYFIRHPFCMSKGRHNIQEALFFLLCF
jgi:hypothetical protein